MCGVRARLLQAGAEADAPFSWPTRRLADRRRVGRVVLVAPDIGLHARRRNELQTVTYKFKLTAVALANKVARIVFALLTRSGQYDDRDRSS